MAKVSAVFPASDFRTSITDVVPEVSAFACGLSRRHTTGQVSRALGIAASATRLLYPKPPQSAMPRTGQREVSLKRWVGLLEMILSLHFERRSTPEQVRAFLEGNEPVDFKPVSHGEGYAFVSQTLTRCE